MESKKMLKRAFMPKTTIIVLIVFIFAFLLSLVAAKVSSGKAAPEPTPITSVSSTETYCFANVFMISDYLAYTDTDRYYAASDSYNNWFVVVISDTKFRSELQGNYEYFYDLSDDAVIPQSVKLTGISEKISDDLAEIFMEYFELTRSEFDYYFGSYMLNAKRSYVSNSETVLILLATVFGACAFVTLIILL